MPELLPALLHRLWPGSSPVQGMALLIILMALATSVSAGVVSAQTPAPTAVPPQASDYPDHPLGNDPVGNDPVGNDPVGNDPVGNDPVGNDPVGNDPVGYDPAEAYAIDGMIMCPVCPAETIGQAQVPIARQMRALVREKLALGATRQEILDFFTQRYGQGILAAPPKSGLNLVAWIFPMAGVAAALVGGLLVLRSMSNRPVDPAAPVPGGAGSEDGLGPYLAMVDRELAVRQNLPESGPARLDEDSSEPPVDRVETRPGNPTRKPHRETQREVTDG